MTNQNNRMPAFIEYLTGYTITWKFKATALAIKYTDAVERAQSGLLHDLSGQDSK
jgi:hypothetical protein